MNSPKFRGVFFDLDGTLLDTTPLIVKSFQHAFQTHYQRPVTLEDIQPYMGKPLRAAMEVMAPGEEDSVIATYRAFNHIHHDQLAGIFEGVYDTVKILYDAGIKMAIVTSKTSVMARRGLRLFDMEKFFTVIQLPQVLFLSCQSFSALAPAALSDLGRSTTHVGHWQ